MNTRKDTTRSPRAHQAARTCRQLFAALVAACIGQGLLNCSDDSVAGGGTDVGNPVNGSAVTSQGLPASDAVLVIGRADDLGVLDTAGSPAAIRYDAPLDSVSADGTGRFRFESIAPGDYVVRAHTAAGLGGAVSFTQPAGGGRELLITLGPAVALAVQPDSLTADTSDMLAARIAGTTLEARRTANGQLLFPAAPIGTLTIVVYARGGVVYVVSGVRVSAGCSPYIVVDPTVPPEQWRSGGCDVPDPFAPPRLVWSSPPPGATGAAARVNRAAGYDVAVQFSHAMNTRLTDAALRATSSDSLAGLSTAWWQGADMLFVRFCARTTAGAACVSGSGWRMGVTYSLSIDTAARSLFGIAPAAPMSVSFTPEPRPRVVSVDGFRFRVASTQQSWDSLPPVVSLGDSVSPAVASASLNKLDIAFAGTPVDSTLAAAVQCYRDSLPVAFTLLRHSQAVTVRLADYLSSDASYRVVVDTSLRFAETGGSLTQALTVRWHTTAFTLDTALILGQYDLTRLVPLVTSLPQASSYAYLNSYGPNLPYTTFYVSSNVDSASVRAHVLHHGFFPDDSLRFSGNAFGWRAGNWLPSATAFSFTLLPGLRSQAGDSLADSVTFVATTDSLKLMNCNVFGLYTGSVNGSLTLPRQDSLYIIPSGVLTYSGGTIDYLPHSYAAVVQLNAPVDSAAMAPAFTVTPAVGFARQANRTGQLLSSGPMLLADTTYSVTLLAGLADSFGTVLNRPFAYQLRTERFELKVGNLFGVFFGKDPRQTPPPPGLPQQPLPPITIIENLAEPIPVVYYMDSSFTVYQNVLADQARVVSLSSGSYGAWFYSPSTGAYTPIGIPVSSYEAQFPDNVNYLSFSAVLDSQDAPSHVVVEPADGTVRVKVDRHRLRFSADSYARSGTLYTITVLPTLRDIAGHLLGDSLRVAFTTPRFSLRSVTVNGSTLPRDSILAGVSLSGVPTSMATVELTFSHSLDIGTIGANVSFDPPIKGRVAVNRQLLTVASSELLIPDTTYRLSVSQGILEIHGPSLDTSYVAAFCTQPFRASITVGSVQDSSLVVVSANSTLDRASLAGALHVQPARYASGRFVPDSNTTFASFVPDSAILFGDHVVAILDTTLADRYGRRIAEPDTMDFIVNTMPWLGKQRAAR